MIELISIHIPKTGGRSFNTILKQVYGDRKVFNISREVLKRLGQNLEQVLPENAVVLHGHLKFSDIASVYEQRPVPLLTWLRDPVERVISDYYFKMERIQSGARPEWIDYQNEALPEYMRRKGERNLMSRYLYGASLKEIFFVGLLEHFREDLMDLGRMLQWKKTKPVVANCNKKFRSQFGPVSEELRREIAQYNSEDVALYQEALDLRKQRRIQTRPRFFQALEWIKK